MDEEEQSMSDQAPDENDSSSVIYDTDEEGAKDYRVGGYHPVALGDLFLNRYLVVQKLGWGHFSTVWLCKDQLHDTYVALKVQKSATNYTEAAYDEIEILMKISSNTGREEWVLSVQAQEANLSSEEVVRDRCYVVQILNSFVHLGPNGKHVCMVFEVLGVNLLEIIKQYNYKGIPMPICRVISRQVLMGLDYMHRICGIIHTDLKPENVLVQLSQLQIAQILLHGKLNPKETVNVLPTPLTPLCPQMSQTELTEEEKKEAERKEQKKAKRKKYKQRKKEEAKLLKEATATEAISTQASASEVIKKKKHKKKKAKKGKKNAEEEALPDLPDPSAIEEEAAEPVLPAKPTSLSLDDQCSKPDENIKIKIADLGNACWFNNHFSTEIQTRQYRSPEVIIGVSYNYTADLWSFACMLFELVTGDFLFEPKSGRDFDKDDDHLAQMIETLGRVPVDFALSGINSKRFFTRNGELRRIKQLRFWPLKSVLVEKYRLSEVEAQQLSSFLLPMLKYKPENRSSAQAALRHPWLNMPSNYDYRITNDEEYQRIIEAQEARIKEQDELLMRGDIPSTPEIPMEQSDTDADDEYESDYEGSVESEQSEYSEKQDEFEENLEYHHRMLAFKQDTQRV
jgi:serine/threonine-protein kinase SRPK3